MDDTLLNDYIERVTAPLYPNTNKTMAVFDCMKEKLNQGPVIFKLDAGPGRIVSSEDILSKREELFEHGLIVLMGLCNATSIQQEIDALCGAVVHQVLVLRTCWKTSQYYSTVVYTTAESTRYLYLGHPENVLETVKWKLIMAVE